MCHSVSTAFGCLGNLQSGRLTDLQPGRFKTSPELRRSAPARFRFLGPLCNSSLRSTQRKTLDFYYLGSDLKHAVFNQGSGHQNRHTLGARAWGERGPWAYDAEAMYQFGSFGVDTITAWRVGAD